MSKTDIIYSISRNDEHIKRVMDRREWIIKNASIGELQCLTDFENGNIKAMAYEGLIKNKDFSNKKEIILKAIIDTKYKIYDSGIPKKSTIGEYLVYRVLKLDDQPPTENIRKKYIDSIDEVYILNEFEKVKRQQ